MKKFLVMALSLVLLCGCVAKEDVEMVNAKTVPTIMSFDFPFEDIAVYKTNWNGVVNEEKRAVNYSVERYLSHPAKAGEEIELTFSDDPPDVVRATEWIINDVETPLKDDPDIICTDIEGVLSEGKFSFKLCDENKSGITIEKRLVVFNCKWDSGEEVEYAFLADVTDNSINEIHMIKAEDIDDVEGVTVTLESDGTFRTYAIADIRNDTDKYVELSDWYRIDILEGNEWYKLNYLPSVTSVAWEKEGYAVASGYGTKLVVEWTNLFGELPAGDYRLVKTVTFEGEEPVEIGAAFTVPEIIID